MNICAGSPLDMDGSRPGSATSNSAPPRPAWSLAPTMSSLRYQSIPLTCRFTSDLGTGFKKIRYRKKEASGGLTSASWPPYTAKMSQSKFGWLNGRLGLLAKQLFTRPVRDNAALVSQIPKEKEINNLVAAEVSPKPETRKLTPKT